MERIIFAMVCCFAIGAVYLWTFMGYQARFYRIKIATKKKKITQLINN